MASDKKIIFDKKTLDRLYVARVGKGCSWASCGKLLGYNKATCQRNFEENFGVDAPKKYYHAQKPLEEKRAHRQKRKCLRCGNMFDSFGPGNRLCEDCTRYAASVSV